MKRQKFSVIDTNKKIQHNNRISLTKNLEENTNIIERLEKLNYDSSESLNTDKVEQNKKKIEKLQRKLESVNKDIEYKHKESQNLIRTKGDR